LDDAGDDDVVMVLDETTRARGTEALIKRDLFFVWTTREGTATRLGDYQTGEEALEAAGLRERASYDGATWLPCPG
jgi:hypothetical protein